MQEKQNNGHKMNFYIYTMALLCIGPQENKHINNKKMGQKTR